MIDIKKIYEARFTTYERIRKNELWEILCQDYMQKFINSTDKVVDVGAGHCEFINNITAGERIAVDVNSDCRKFAGKNVKVVISSVKHLKKIFPVNSINIVFMSNLLEHLDNKEDVFRLLSESYEVLKKGGRLLIMQPDISLVGHEYWDYFDHKVPITSTSLVEVLTAIGFKIAHLHNPFLPYTTKTRFLPLWPLLLRLYIKLPFLHPLFGKQFFVVAEK